MLYLLQICYKFVCMCSDEIQLKKLLSFCSSLVNLWSCSPPAGVSVCLRYMADNLQSGFPLFTLSPNRSPLSLEVNLNSYGLTFSGYYNYVYLRPLIKFWPNIGSDFWTSVCLTVDTRKGVVQMFSGSNMSIRKVLPSQVRTGLKSACRQIY